MGVGTPPGNYFSPWDIWWNRGSNHVGNQPSYVFDNGDGGVDGNNSPYTLRVYAWIGLAYFDGSDDLNYQDHSNGNFYVLSNATHPNLVANGHEVGNLIKSDYLEFRPAEGTRMENNLNHLPLHGLPNSKYPLPFSWPYAQARTGFTFPANVLGQEISLLRDYGKVFFYEVEVYEAGALIDTYTMYPEVATLNPAITDKWQPVIGSSMAQLQTTVNANSYDLFYFTDYSLNPTLHSPSGNNSTNFCNSYEIVAQAPNMHEYLITGGSTVKTLRMDFMAHHKTMWYNSALSLRVYN